MRLDVNRFIYLMNLSKCDYHTDSKRVWDNLGLLVKAIDVTLEDGSVLRLDITVHNSEDV